MNMHAKALADMKRHFDEFMVEMEETPEQAVESIFCNFRDDHPCEYFSWSQALWTMTVDECEGVLDEVYRLHVGWEAR